VIFFPHLLKYVGGRKKETREMLVRHCPANAVAK